MIEPWAWVSRVYRCERDDEAVGVEGHIHDRAFVDLLHDVAPAALVAELDHVEGADAEVLAVGRPAASGDGVVVGRRGVEEDSVRVPDLVPAVFAAGQDHVVLRVPVHVEHAAVVVSFPSQLAETRLQGFDVDHFARTANHLVVFRVPGHAVDRLVQLEQLGAELTVLRPDLAEQALP